MTLFDYAYNLPFGTEELELFETLYGVLASVGSLLNLVCYIFTALSLYTIARRRGLNNAWLAWVPVGFEWLLGSVSDQYQYLVKEKTTSRRKVLLGLSVANGCAALIAGVVAVVMVFKLAFSAAAMTEAQIAQMVLGPLMTVLVAALVLSVVSITLLVFRCVCMYDVYRSCQPDSATLFLVLGILFGFLEPIFLMICRNKDEGMPPRKPAIEQPPAPQYEEPYWERTE